MEWTITKDPNFKVLELSEIKSTLRINHSQEDTKLTELEKSAVSFWENQTSYILNASAVKLSIIPQRDLLLSSYPKSADYLSTPQKPLYSPPLALDIETQKPTAVSYTQDGAQKQFTPDELNNLSDNFFNMVAKVPLQFYLFYRNFPESIFGSQFYTLNRQYHSKLIMDLACQGLTAESDIKQCLLRIISGLYENPDVSADIVEKDVFINNTMDTYNMTLGIA